MAVSTTISFNDFLNSSCSVVMCGSPVSARSRFALLSRIAGAYVSGIVAHIHATTPANIMLTYNARVRVVSTKRPGYAAYPEYPPPADGLSDEAANDWSEDGAAALRVQRRVRQKESNDSPVRRSRKQRDREPALVVVPDVCDGASCERERSRAKQTAKES